MVQYISPFRATGGPATSFRKAPQEPAGDHDQYQHQDHDQPGRHIRILGGKPRQGERRRVLRQAESDVRHRLGRPADRRSQRGLAEWATRPAPLRPRRRPAAIPDRVPGSAPYASRPATGTRTKVWTMFQIRSTRGILSAMNSRANSSKQAPMTQLLWTSARSPGRTTQPNRATNPSVATVPYTFRPDAKHTATRKAATGTGVFSTQTSQMGTGL